MRKCISAVVHSFKIHFPSSGLPLRLLLNLVLLLSLLPLPVSADIGPKPTAGFHFMWETDDQLTINEGILMQCKDPACAESHPLEDLGPQHFTCSNVACDSMAYGYSQYARLVVTFSDGITRESNVFEKKYDDSQYEVTVRASDLSVVEKRGTFQPFETAVTFSTIMRVVGIALGFIAFGVFLTICVILVLKTAQNALEYQQAKIPCLSIWIITLPVLLVGLVFAPTVPLTILIEGIVISLYTLIKKQRWFPWATVVTLGNLLTQTLFLIALAGVGSWGMPVLLTIVLEIVVWLLEAVLIHLTLRRKESIAGSLGISLLINVVSMGIGLLLPI